MARGERGFEMDSRGEMRALCYALGVSQAQRQQAVWRARSSRLGCGAAHRGRPAWDSGCWRRLQRGRTATVDVVDVVDEAAGEKWEKEARAVMRADGWARWRRAREEGLEPITEKV